MNNHPAWIRVCLVACLSLLTTAAQAILIFSGTGERITFRDCIAGVTPCDTTSGIIQDALGGFPGALASSANITSPIYGSGSASVSLSGVAGAPNLTAHSASEAGSRVNTNSAALQQFTYTGLSATTRTYEGNLNYSQTFVGGPYPAGISPGLAVLLRIFTLPGGAGFEVGDTPLSNLLALADPSLQPGYTLLGETSFSNPNNNIQNGTANFGVTVTLNPGDSFFVSAFIQTPAAGGTLVDVFSLNTQWDNSSDLIPAGVAVPEPATLALLGLGLAGLGFSRRKH